MLSLELLRRGCDVAIGKSDNREVDLSQLRWMIKYIQSCGFLAVKAIQKTEDTENSACPRRNIRGKWRIG